MKPLRLKVTQIKSIKDHFRLYLPKNCYEQVVQLFSHLVWQDDEILRLSRELRERTELDLFQKPIQAPVRASDHTTLRPPADDKRTRLHAILGDPKQLEVYLKIHAGLTKEDLEMELAGL